MRIGHVLRSAPAGGPECRPPHLLVQWSGTVYLLRRMYQLSLLRVIRVVVRRRWQGGDRRPALSWMPSGLTAAPCQQPHDDEDDGRDQACDQERLEHRGKPADDVKMNHAERIEPRTAPIIRPTGPIVRTRCPVAGGWR